MLSSLELLKGLFPTCPNCHCAFDGNRRAPYVLTCAHTFCSSCLKKEVGKPRRRRRCFHKDCGETFTTPRLNVTLAEQVEKMWRRRELITELSIRCDECQMMVLRRQVRHCRTCENGINVHICSQLKMSCIICFACSTFHHAGHELAAIKENNVEETLPRGSSTPRTRRSTNSDRLSCLENSTPLTRPNAVKISGSAISEIQFATPTPTNTTPQERPKSNERMHRKNILVRLFASCFGISKQESEPPRGSCSVAVPPQMLIHRHSPAPTDPDYTPYVTISAPSSTGKNSAISADFLFSHASQRRRRYSDSTVGAIPCPCPSVPMRNPPIPRVDKNVIKNHYCYSPAYRPSHNGPLYNGSDCTDRVPESISDGYAIIG